MWDFYYILILSLLPFLYKLSFWLYVIQLKEYRFDRFKEYLITSQWKKAILNFLLIPEITVLIVAILFFLGKVSSPTIYYSLTFLLQFENLYVFYKIFSLKFHIPKKTWRLIILSSLIILNLFFIFFWLYFNKVYIYLILPFFLVCFPCLVLLVNSLTQPIFDFKKKQIFHQATKKIKQQKIHTIWITWSFGKSSTKEYLTHILVKKYKVFKTPKNINTELGIANLILKTDFSKYNFFIAEMWAYSKWEIKQSWKIINHKDAFVSGIWNQHIWLFGNQQNIIDGKLEIGEKVLENNGKLYINTTNIYEINKNILHIKDKLWIINYKWKTPNILNSLINKNKVIFYWLNKYIKIDFKNKPKYYLWKITKVDKYWTEFIVNNLKLKTKLIWKWQIENLIWTIVYAIEKWVWVDEIQKCINSFEQPKNTLQIITKTNSDNRKITFIDDTYNLSVNSLINWVDIMQYFSWKKLLVVDDILELGEQAKKIHFKLWKYLSSKVDEILFVWINYKKSFLNWLKEWWFKWKILEQFPKFFVENYVILLEGRNAGKYFI